MEKKNMIMRRSGAYLISTENSMNRKNLDQNVFEEMVDFDDAVNEYPEKPHWVQYKQGKVFIAYYNPTLREGYIDARGLSDPTEVSH